MNIFNKKLINKILFLNLIILIVVVLLNTCRPEKEDLCDKYKEYFGDIKYFMSKQDSIDTYNYYHYLKRIIAKSGSPFGGNPFGFSLYYRMKRIDTSFANKILRDYYSDKTQFSQKYGISYYLARYVVASDAVVYGEVISKDNYSDSCLFYKTTYIIRVDSVISSYFPIKKGDKIVIKVNNFGFEGGCRTGDEKKIFTVSSQSYDYKLNQFSIFLLSRDMYITQFNKFIKNNNKYFDKFCYNSFICPNNYKLNELFEISDSKKLIDFVNNINIKYDEKK